MALIQKLQRGKSIPGGANRVSSIKDFDTFVGAVMYGGPEATKIPYTFTSKSEDAIRRDWDSFKKLESELSKKNLKIEDVFKYDPVTRKHNVDQTKVKELEESGDFDQNALKNILEYTPEEGVKTYALSGIRTTRDGIAALLDLKVAYNDYVNKPKPVSSSASWSSAFTTPSPSAGSTTGFDLSHTLPTDPYLDLSSNAVNYAAMSEDQKKAEMFHRGKSRINTYLEKVTNANNPDILALRDFYKNNETYTTENWEEFKQLAGRLDWTVNFNTPTSDGSSGDSETKTYEVDDDLYTTLKQSNATISRTGENEYSVEGLTAPFLYKDKILYEKGNGKWTLVDKNSAPSSTKEWIKKEKSKTEDLFTISGDKVITRESHQKPITIGNKSYDRFINLTPNTDLPNDSEFLLTEQVFDDFGNTTQLIGTVVQGNKRWPVIYNLREDGTYGVNPASSWNFPENLKSFRINKNPNGRPIKRINFSFTGVDENASFNTGNRDLSNIELLPVTYKNFNSNFIGATPDTLKRYLRWLQKYTSKHEEMGWDPNKVKIAIDRINEKLGTDVEKKQLGGIILADIKKEEVEKPKVEKPTNNPNERALASMDTTDKWLLGADAAATGLSMAGGVAGVIGGLALLTSGIVQGIRNDASTADIAKNAAVNLGFAALAFVPGMSAFRAAKGAKSLLGATKTAKKVEEAVKVAKVARKAKLANLIDDAVKTGKPITNAEEALSGLDKVIKLGQNNIDDAIKLLSTSKNKTVQVEKAISNLEKAKEAVTPNFVKQIVSGGPVLKTISLATRGSLVVDGLVNGIPSALKIADVTFDKMRGEDVNFSHVITEGDLRNTLRLAGASKALKQFANQGLVRLGTTSTAKPTAAVKPAETTSTEVKPSSTIQKVFTAVGDAGKSTKAQIKDTSNKLFGNNDRVLKPSSIDDGWFTTLAKSRAAKFGYTKEGFNPNLNGDLAKLGMFEKGKLSDDIVKTINELLNK